MRLLKYSEWASVSPAERTALLERPVVEKNKNISAQVSEILQTIKTQGDSALREYTLKYDQVAIRNFKVSSEEILAGFNQTSETIKESLRVAISNIEKFHKAQIQEPLKIETMAGVVCEKRTVAIEKIGLYIPGGTAPLPSTLLMLGVPAQVAGCAEIQLVTPPQKDGAIHPVILTAAYLLGLKNIYKCGGAQAIAALAYGTESIPKVYKIFGPGNAWVTEAKMQVAYEARGAAIDLPAGPSEVLVIADGEASPEFVAADLLSQAEHDTASQVILVTTSRTIADQVDLQLQLQLETLSRRDIAKEALRSSRCFLVNSVQEALEISNTYAPEHLILHVENPRFIANGVKNAGSVFVGPWSPESVGDYASGTNHVLPTYGYARAFSGLSLESFTKSISFQELTSEGLKKLGPHVVTLAQAESLDAHGQAVSRRLQKLRQDAP